MSSKSIIAAAPAAVAAATAIPALTAAQGSAARGSTLREKVKAVKFVHTERHAVTGLPGETA